MEDDEEYSYKAYSERTREQFVGDVAEFKDNDEVHYYTGYSDESAVADGAAEEGYGGSYGDFIVEEFSAEHNVSRVAEFTRLPANAATYLVAAVYLIVGVLCVSITRSVTAVLPYLVGGMMILLGTVQFITAVIHKEYRQTRTNKTATSLIVAALGIMILVQQFDDSNDSAVMLISIVWGIFGLFEGARAFNHAFKRIANSERCVYYLLKGIIECVVGFMLLYQPDSHDAHFFHVIVFGANLIFDSVTMIPQVKTFLTMK